MRIGCVGGGSAGLYSSVLVKLRDPGHDVCVYERNGADTAPGWGVTFNKELPRELRGEVYNISRTQLLEILATWARDLGVRIEHGKEVGAPADLADADLTVCGRDQQQDAAGGKLQYH